MASLPGTRSSSQNATSRSTARRRFAGVLVDVFYDHFLARHWAHYSAQPLQDFTQQVYTTLAAQAADYPERLQRILPIMHAQDWLASYVHIESVDAALHGIARRFQRYPRAAVLADGVQELIQNYAALEQQFLEFFPDLLEFVQASQRPSTSVHNSFSSTRVCQQ